jgi:hypothetical protein
MFRGYAAGASALLIQSGATALVADTWVAERLRRRGSLKPDTQADRRITAATIKGWRKEARERGPGDLVRTVFDLCLKNNSPLGRHLPYAGSEYPEELLERLAKRGSEFRPANVSRNGMLYSLIAIAYAVGKFPPPEVSGK